MGYQKLVQEVTGVALKKGETCLTDAPAAVGVAVDYAATTCATCMRSTTCCKRN
jgi:hypothetical protein